MRRRTRIAAICIFAGPLCAAAVPACAAAADLQNAQAVRSVMEETCSLRGLGLAQPVAVRAMDAFGGGYTAGVGSVRWEDGSARAWSDAWCAFGVYCDQPDSAAAAPDGAAAAAATTTPLAAPRGLYDRAGNTLYVAAADGISPEAVAHETTHALQFQNFPELNAAHLWSNRDLSAAVHAVVEGDAHLVGNAFDSGRRLQLCSIDPQRASAYHADAWSWSPDALWAHEGFGHVFGIEHTLRELLAGGTAGVDAALRAPPLSTLAVLRPELPRDVDFIRLPDGLAAAARTASATRPPELAKDCAAGLRNTAGAVGIWGLLRRHGDADAADGELPAFLESWRGDRFEHIACAGQGDDELAWVTSWRTASAAAEFARRYRAIAPRIAARSGLLASVPEATVRGLRVVVATAGLRRELGVLAAAPARAFDRYTGWIDGGCYPLEACISAPQAPPAHVARAPGDGFACYPRRAASNRLDGMASRIRTARALAAARGDAVGELASIAAAAGELAAFCAANAGRNADLAEACSAAYSGIAYLERVRANPAWGLLPYCATADELRNWIGSSYYGTPPQGRRLLADPSAFRMLHGVPLVASRFAISGLDGLRALAHAPPLSTLAVLRPELGAEVEMIRLPMAQLARLGCESNAGTVLGVLGIWNLLMDYGAAPDSGSLPPFLLDWRGDRQFHLRCGADDPDGRRQDAWGWVSRWRSAAAARQFAARYADIAPLAGSEIELAAGPAIVLDRTVWILPSAIRDMAASLSADTEFRAFADLDAWADAGCFPQTTCNVARVSATDSGNASEQTR